VPFGYGQRCRQWDEAVTQNADHSQLQEFIQQLNLLRSEITDAAMGERAECSVS
jgi:hypothetical protein